MADSKVEGAWDCTRCTESVIPDEFDRCPKCEAEKPASSGRGGKREGTGRKPIPCLCNHSGPSDINAKLMLHQLKHLVGIGGLAHVNRAGRATWDGPPLDKSDDLIRAELIDAGVCKSCVGNASYMAYLRNHLFAVDNQRVSNPNLFLFMDPAGEFKVLEFALDFTYTIRDVKADDYIRTPSLDVEGAFDVPRLDLSLESDEDDPEPLFVIRVMRGVWKLEDGEIARFRAWLKSCMIRSKRHDIVFYLESAPGTGKGTLYDILRAVFRTHLEPAPARNWNDYTQATFFEKGLVVMNEANLSPTDWDLLTQCTNSELTIHRKYQNPFKAWLGCKFLLLSANAPGRMLTSVGIGRRLSILRSPALEYDGGVEDESIKLDCTAPDEVSRFARWMLGGDLSLIGNRTKRMSEWVGDTLYESDAYRQAVLMLEKSDGSVVEFSDWVGAWNESRDLRRNARVDRTRLRKELARVGFSIEQVNRKRWLIHGAVLRTDDGVVVDQRELDAKAHNPNANEARPRQYCSCGKEAHFEVGGSMYCAAHRDTALQITGGVK